MGLEIEYQLNFWKITVFIYINDLPNISKILNLYLFADDTNIYHESNPLNDLERTVNKELNKLYLWLNLNRLSGLHVYK